MPKNYHRTKQDDHYPHLRKRSRYAQAVMGRPLPRRARMINKALRRADRRWDAYAVRVRSAKLEWDESRRTMEWRLVLQNSRLLKGLRRLPSTVDERSERLARLRNSEVEVPTVSLYERTSRHRSDSVVGE